MKLLLTTFLILLGVMSTSILYAETSLDQRSTPNGYQRMDFCGKDGSALKTISELSQSDSINANEIEKLKKEINSLNANKILINNFLKIRDDFTKAYKALANDESKKAENLAHNLDSFKSLIKSSLTLNVVNLLVKAQPEKAQKNSVFELCKNENSNFCNYINNLTFKIDLRPDISQLNETIKNVNLALSNSSNQDEIKRDLARIYDSIPSPISPDKVLADLVKTSPNLISILGKSPNKETILSCLNGIDNSNCSKLLNDKSSREDLTKILSSEMSDSQRSITKDKLDKIFIDHDAPSSKSRAAVLTLMNKQATEASAFLEKQLNDPNKKIESLGIDKADLDEFKETCIQKENKPFDKKSCEIYANKMVSYFEKQDSANSELLSKALAKLNKLTDKNSSYDGIEKMKQYLAEKYIRTCDNATEADIDIASNCRLSNTAALDVSGEGSEIGRLNKGISNAIGTLKNKPISKEKGELGPFSKSELNVYMNYCKNTSVAKTARNVCADITKEYNKIADKKESWEWEKLNKDYYVEQTNSNEKGYRIIPKKTNAKIFGEAFARSAPNFLPMLLGNMQFKSQLDLMTNQALYSKQMIYMSDPTSPWMANYFSGSFFTGVTMPTVMNTPAFNFTK